jgi:Amt family ammonium transporter
LITQLIGVAAVFVWAFSLGFLLFKLIKITIGVRVSKEEEEKGLDITEHGEEVYN